MEFKICCIGEIMYGDKGHLDVENETTDNKIKR